MKRRTFFTRLAALVGAAFAATWSVARPFPDYYLAKDENGVWQGHCCFSDGEKYIYRNGKWNKL